MNSLRIQIVKNPEDAPHYVRDEIDVRSATITDVVIVENGTVSRKPTVDFQFQDQQGGKYVAMLTGELVKNLSFIVSNPIDQAEWEWPCRPSQASQYWNGSKWSPIGMAYPKVPESEQTSYNHRRYKL